LDALTGFGQDCAAGTLRFRRPDEPERPVPFLAAHGWGTWSASATGLVLDCTGGRIDVRELTISGDDPPRYVAAHGAAGLAVDAGRTDDGCRLAFAAPLSLGAGERLVLTARPW
jgi:hypothetical protein